MEGSVIGRRDLLRRGLAMGAAGGAATVLGGAAAHEARPRHRFTSTSRA